MARVNSRIRRLIELVESIPSRDGADERCRINLSRRYRPVLLPLRRLLIGGCVLLVFGILWDFKQAIMGYEECQILEARLDQVRQQNHDVIAEARREGIELSDEALSRLPFEVDLANQLLEKRTFSWTKFLAELEQALPARLTLRSIRLDQSSTTVWLTGAAMSLEDITTFTVGLQDHATFKDPVLAQHRIGSNGLVEFDITVHYHLDGV